MSKFIPSSVVTRPAWSTPGYFPEEQKFTPYSIVERIVADGISAQSKAQLKRLEMENQPKPVAPTTSPQTMDTYRGMIQLPNGQYVTKEQYQQLIQLLNKRS